MTQEHANLDIEGRYRLLKTLSRSQSADVWDAFDLRLSRPVAVKIMNPESVTNPVALTRFRNEANVGARLVHRNIIETFDAGTARIGEDSLPYLVMERIHGKTLREKINEGISTEVQIQKVGGEIAEALDFAHENGFLHGDVKPTNILLSVTSGSSDMRAVLGDFGLTTTVSRDDETEMKIIGGSAAYAAPEVLQGNRPTVSSDVYSLGIVLYEMATGTPPFILPTEKETIEFRINNKSPSVLLNRTDLSPPMAQVIDKAIANDPNSRYLSAQALKAALLFASRDTDIALESNAVTPRENKKIVVKKPKRSRAPLYAFISFAAFSTLLFGIVAQFGGFKGFETKKSPDSSKPVAIQTISAFDPQGDGKENDAQLNNMIDSDSATVWNTQRYNSSKFGGLKTGLGFILNISSTTVSKVNLQNVSNGAQFSLYDSNQPHQNLAQWGNPLASGTVENGALTLQLPKSIQTSELLIWITDLGPDQHVSIGDVEVIG